MSVFVAVLIYKCPYLFSGNTCLDDVFNTPINELPQLGLRSYIPCTVVCNVIFKFFKIIFSQSKIFWEYSIWREFPVRSKIVVGNKILEQVWHFAFPGCDVGYEHGGDKNKQLDVMNVTVIKIKN